jgi:hypothetical protein
MCFFAFEILRITDEFNIFANYASLQSKLKVNFLSTHRSRRNG